MYTGTSGNDSLTGGTGNDLLDGGAGNDTLHGGKGDDFLTGGTGDDQLDGAEGNDTAVFSGTYSQYLFAHTSGSTAYTVVDTVAGRDGTDLAINVEFFKFADVTKAAADLTLSNIGTINNDSLMGTSGNDTLSGGAGNDALEGGPGNDLLDGGTGFDSANYSHAPSAVYVDLAAGTATGGDGVDTLVSIEVVTGSSYADSINGNSDNNVLWGQAGNDFLDGAAGDDFLFGDTGNDTLVGGDGNDTLDSGMGTNILDGGAGRDVADLGGFGPVFANLETGVATSTGTVDTLINIENIVGSTYDDSLTGSGDANRLDAYEGNDTVSGGAGNDSLYGGKGNDSLDGGTGDDDLEGDRGNDTINGGAGLDVAAYDGIRASHSVDVSNGVATVRDPNTDGDGTDTLTGIERLKFSDGGIALDLTGNAGKVLMAIGAVFGALSINDQHYVGVGLQQLDRGVSFDGLIQLALDARLGPTPSHQAEVDLLFTNIVGAAPTAQQEAVFVSLLDSGQYSETSLGAFAAQTPTNVANVGLDAWARTGLPFEWLG